MRQWMILVLVVAFAGLQFDRASAQVGPASRPAGRTVVWTGGGADSLWTTAANWSGGQAPGESDDVKLDGTSVKDCSWVALSGRGREAKGPVIGSLTVSPEYTGTLKFLSPGTIRGSLRLTGRVTFEFDAHVSLLVLGPEVDLAGITVLKCRFGGGSITMAASEGVQTLMPTTQPDRRLPEVIKRNGGVLRLGGFLNTISLGVDSKSAIDLNDHDVEAQLLQIAGPIQNLGGRTITVTGAVGYTYNAIGFMRGGGSAAKPLDLSPDKPWRLVRKKDKLLVLYGPREEWDFSLENCRIGNCDASGSQTALVAHKGSVDAGNNKGITFGPWTPPPPASKPASRPSTRSATRP